MMRIAIDGTASAGKGSVARGVSRRLGFSYVDTGAMYRTIALMCDRKNISFCDHQKINDLLNSITFKFYWEKDRLQVLSSGENVTELIRTEEMGQGASKVSTIPLVRQALSHIQRLYAQNQSVVMDGRDIGTVIIPGAELKVFVDADIEVRAKRRQQEMLNKGIDMQLELVSDELLKRDHRDKTRKIAPLIQASDARLLDTTNLGIDAAIDIVYGWVQDVLVQKQK
jgi:CMP/dCMP kinase